MNVWEQYKKFTRDLLVRPLEFKPKIVCDTCGEGPLTGYAIFKHGEIRFCEEHPPEKLPKKKQNQLNKARWRI
jgi:hypothetical protein